jgi:pyruvate dehydrogenase E1 component beta subunit
LESMGEYLELTMDQIVNQAAKMKYMTGDSLSVPIVIRTQGGAGRGVGGSALPKP